MDKKAFPAMKHVRDLHEAHHPSHNHQYAIVRVQQNSIELWLEATAVEHSDVEILATEDALGAYLDGEWDEGAARAFLQTLL